MPEDVTYLNGFIDVWVFKQTTTLEVGTRPALLKGWNPAWEWVVVKMFQCQRWTPHRNYQHSLSPTAVEMTSLRQTSPCTRMKSRWLKHNVFQREDSFWVDNFAIYIQSWRKAQMWLHHGLPKPQTILTYLELWTKPKCFKLLESTKYSTNQNN